MRDKILIIGCGDTGKRVITSLSRENYLISVTSHSQPSQALLNELSVNVIAANLDKPNSLTNLPTQNSYVFYFAPPAAKGVTDDRMLHFINSLDKQLPPKRITYISTTGVYGNCHGQWITEKSPLNPGNDRSRRRLHAESLINEFCKNSTCDWVILRVSGIYAPAKFPLDRLKNGVSVLAPDIAPSSNRIHADDLANCCIRAMFHSPANEIYNIADGHPSSISDYFIQLAKKYDLPTPNYLSWDQAEKELSPAMLSYLHESKKINIDKLINVLNIKLKYPTLRDGLEAC